MKIPVKLSFCATGQGGGVDPSCGKGGGGGGLNLPSRTIEQAQTEQRAKADRVVSDADKKVGEAVLAALPKTTATRLIGDRDMYNVGITEKYLKWTGSESKLQEIIPKLTSAGFKLDRENFGASVFTHPNGARAHAYMDGKYSSVEVSGPGVSQFHKK